MKPTNFRSDSQCNPIKKGGNILQAILGFMLTRLIILTWVFGGTLSIWVSLPLPKTITRICYSKEVPKLPCLSSHMWPKYTFVPIYRHMVVVLLSLTTHSFAIDHPNLHIRLLPTSQDEALSLPFLKTQQSLGCKLFTKCWLASVPSWMVSTGFASWDRDQVANLGGGQYRNMNWFM